MVLELMWVEKPFTLFNCYCEAIQTMEGMQAEALKILNIKY